MKMNIFYFFAFILLSTLFSCSGGPANDPRSIYTYQTMQGEMFNALGGISEKASIINEVEQDKSSPYTQKYAKKALLKWRRIEQELGEAIALIEETKRLLFLQMGENIKVEDTMNTIRYRKYDSRYPTEPAGYDLAKVKNNETTDVLSPNGAFAKKIQIKMKQLRKVLTEIAAFHEKRDYTEKTYFFKDPNINAYSSYIQLREMLEKSGAVKHVAVDDLEIVLRIYSRLSYKTDFWENSFEENLPWLEAFGFLISLENDILNATNDALSIFYYQLGFGGSYNFTEILALVNGDEFVPQGKNPTFEVFLGALLYINDPIVKANGAKVISVKDGKAYLTADMGNKNELTISGTLTVITYSGIPKTFPWKKTFYREPN